MIISDKQELRRCVKQSVRRAPVCEASLDFDLQQGELGIEAVLDRWARPAASPTESFRRTCSDQTPFNSDALAMFSALDAMGFPVNDPDRAQAMERSYDRNAYIREILDAMRAKCVMVRVPVSKSDQLQLDDDRFSVLLEAESDLFIPGRYGLDYAGIAKRISDAAVACGAENLTVSYANQPALKYCILPVCQDMGMALHIYLDTQESIAYFSELLDQFDGVYAVVSSPAELQPALIRTAVSRVRMLVRLSDLKAIRYALSELGVTRFSVYGACASQPEIMLGRWMIAKEEIWQELADAYLPLAKSGYELQSAAIERDIQRIICGNMLAICRRQQ